MAPIQIASLIFALALAEVTSWTIDLPEMRKYFFEKSNAEKRKEFELDKEYYNNIEPNSKHHAKHVKYDDTAYAREYGYQSYMENKVNSIVYNGSIYLEGLRRALDNYTQHIETCNSYNRTEEKNMNLPSNTTILAPEPTPSNTTRCKEATRSSEHVRRLAQLALSTTKELQDIAYSRRYKKEDPYVLTQQENELILKLAWFLDRIAHYTGYEPSPHDFLREESTSTTSPPPSSPPPVFVSPSPELKRRFMTCLKQESDVPAVDRCRYPEPLPPMLQMLLEMNENMTATSTMSMSSPTSAQADTAPEPSQELLIAADNRTPTNFAPNTMSLVSSVRSKRSLSIPQPEVVKRAKNVDDPLLHFLKYYAKHKVWEGSNKNSPSSPILQAYDVKNQLSHRKKRAIDKKSKYLRLPENPNQDISNYVKHKKGVNYVDDHDQLVKIKASLDKMKKKPSGIVKNLFRPKRSLKYEKDVDEPRESANPQKGNSYYVKNKPGRNYNNDIVQATQVRAGLEQIYNTGNIEVVRRFGSNYNPLIPDPFTFGVMRTIADF